MITKSNKEDFQDYLTDASNLQGGFANKLFIPETLEEVSEILRKADKNKTPITISGARTGTVGGAIPFGGVLVSLERFKKLEITKGENKSGIARVGAGVLLTDLQKAVEAEGLFYPPDPTEWSCQIGGTVATNASGARSFKYGSTRNFVVGLEIVLANGEILRLKRGEQTTNNGILLLQTPNGAKIEAKLPTYRAPETRKNTSGYFSEDKLDPIDLFIGSEGTLGIITEVELKLLPKPQSFLSGIIFFEDKNNLLNFVSEIRDISFKNRKQDKNRVAENGNPVNATVLEYFDENSLSFIRKKFPETPANMAGAIFFEQETTSENEDQIFEAWNEFLEKNQADIENSWFAINDQDLEKMRNFRHALPVSVNELIVKNKQRKVGTDMAVPDENFNSFLKFYQTKLKESGLDYVIFGHIGDNHLHANMIPKNEAEMIKARHLYGRFIAQAIMLGGTVSAEHGIGKLKSKYLYVMYGERYLNEMAQLKKAFDPKGILGRGNLFDQSFLDL